MKERVFTYPVLPLKRAEWTLCREEAEDKIHQEVSDFVDASVIQVVNRCANKDGLRITIRVEGIEYGEED